MSSTKIEWTDATWNPTTGCTRVSAGCDHCYAVQMTKRLAAIGQAKYQGLTGRGHFNGELKTHDDELKKPLRWKKPRMVFVNSMSDLFHEQVPFEFIDRVFCIMNATQWTLPISDRSNRWHTYQILTKRPDRLADYMLSRARKYDLGMHPIFTVRGETMRGHGNELMNAAAILQWPPANVWIGTSCEDQATADKRIPHLLRCPAAVRFLSCEPLLGPLDLNRIPRKITATSSVIGSVLIDGPTSGRFSPILAGSGERPLDWIIAGGESGPGARPMHPDWARSLRDQCQAAGVPFFFKQWGEWLPACQIHMPPNPHNRSICIEHDGGAVHCYRVGKRAAGRQLDGREWNEYPTDASTAPRTPARRPAPQTG
jgi:protein gp37